MLLALVAAQLSALSLVVLAGKPFRIGRPPVAVGLFGFAMVSLGTISIRVTTALFPDYDVRTEPALWLSTLGFCAAALPLLLARRRVHRAPQWSWQPRRFAIALVILAAVSVLGMAGALARIGYIPAIRGDVEAERVGFAGAAGIFFRLAMFGVPLAILAATSGWARIQAGIKPYLLAGLGLLAAGLFGPRFFPVVAVGTLVVWRDLWVKRVRLAHLAAGATLALALLILLSIHRSGGTPSLATFETIGYFAFAEFRDFAWSLGYFADPAYRLHGATIPGAIVPVLPGGAWSLVGVDKDALFALNSADVMAALSGAPVGIRVGLIGELYMNFGTPGVAIGMVLFGLLLVWLDRRMLASDSGDPFAPLLAVTCVLVVFTLVGQLNMFASSMNAFGYPIIATAIVAARRRPVEGDVGR